MYTVHKMEGKFVWVKTLKINWSVFEMSRKKNKKRQLKNGNKMPKNDRFFFVENVQVRSSIPILNFFIHDYKKICYINY